MKLLKFIPILLIPFLLTGCWDEIQIEEYAYVSVIGIDKGTDDKISVTFQIINPQIGTATSIEANEPPSDILTFLSPDLVSARDLSSISIARRLTFSHTNAIVVSEEFAKTDRFFPLLEATQRDVDMRREFSIIICKEKAYEFIRNNKPPFDTRTSKYYDFLTSKWKETGLVPLSTLHKVSQKTLDDTGLLLMAYATTKKEDVKTNFDSEGDFIAGQIDKTDDNPIQMIGAGVLKKGKMIGVLTGDETRLSLMLRPHVVTNNMLATFPDPLAEDFKISAKVSKRSNKIDIKITDDYPIIDVTVPIILSITAIPSQIDYVENMENQKTLINYLEKRLEEKTMKLVKKTQKEFEGEPFFWSYVARQKFWLYEDFKNYNWMEKYKNAKITIKYDVKIEDFGKHRIDLKI
ncbi:Ger(x)C family spore germination protein [Defluviitalea phaphyphila]|uniref:Ger(x)C family spore germination protein n=1 Tax=Defluviitalea phaphyphila TaxID=1473580 RepID=UPI00072FD576|nr:Ger(x)C family spore germination protein [Defluviitalea phaphyphila]